MANICTTEYYIYSPDKEKMKQLDKIMTDKEKTYQSYNRWIGELYKEIMQNEPPNSTSELDLRGWWYEHYFTDNTIRFTVESKWYHNVEAMYIMLNHLFGEDEFVLYYEAEELGCGIFEGNDLSGDVFPHSYCVYTDDDLSYFVDDEDLNDWLKEKYNITLDGVEQFNKDNADSDRYINIYSKEYNPNYL